MAGSVLNTSKITDYFPPSPFKEEDESNTQISEDATEQALNDLSNSSVVITPQSTPDKIHNGKTDSEPVSGETDTKVPACKKGLTKDLDVAGDKEQTKVVVKEEPVTESNEKQTQRPKSRNRARKKKDTSEKSELTNGHTANGPVKPKAPRKKKVDDGLRSTLVTDYFPVRRSDRKSKTEIQKEKDLELETKILTGCEDGLKVEDIENKGRGVMATKKFLRGDFVVEYAGDLIDIPAAKKRDAKYSKDPTKGCYMYYFQFKNKKYCIDATAESGKLGRLLNHSKTHGNCHTKQVSIGDRPYLILVASRDINAGEELLYDYGDRSKESLESHPWLKC